MFKNRKIKKRGLELASPGLPGVDLNTSPRPGESEVDALIRQLVKNENIANDQRLGYQRWWKIMQPAQALDQIEREASNRDLQQLDRDSAIEQRNLRKQGGRTDS